ncbi:hypothetical protein ADIARSV_2691 [Arcticibacter svalbardensis MN12-7]|uniref:Glycosyltransferase n=1 Tax=Arcticibacter svalbardensis MN12-7 TaxID=1150600 RepID=R9GQU4_9SPHI|nr:hypothetical protein [Arcticibacter svalbardensis]EOR94078.1 hypothetical protein ADIARSV_2691 [Arcticibacter svalbardensis MN12-7]
MKAIVLLTGTIDPKNMILTALSSPDIRREQYLRAIKYWCDNAEIPIVFVENSNNDVSDYFKEEISSQKLEVLTFDGNSYSRDLGKGFGEFSCLEYACTNSFLLSEADFVFKVTGRHKILNFDFFYKHIQDLDTVDLLLDFRYNLTFCDSRIFGFKPAFFYKYLMEFKYLVNDSNGIYFENILAKASLRAIADDYIMSPFPCFARVEGTSGTYNKEYKRSFLSYVKNNLKAKMKYLIISK